MNKYQGGYVQKRVKRKSSFEVSDITVCLSALTPYARIENKGKNALWVT